MTAVVCECTRNEKSASAGFTVVELAVVLLLAGLLIVSIWPRAPGRDSLSVPARAAQLAADLRYAQSLSMTSGERHCVTFVPTSGPPFTGYLLTTAASGCSTVEAHPVFGTAQPISLCTSGSCATAAAFPNDFVQFDGLGVPYAASAAPLAADAAITISEGGSTSTVSISAQTGRVVVQ